MKNYCVDVDITLSARIYVEAENEQEAREIALKSAERAPWYHVSNGAFVEAEITDAYEELD